MRSCSVINNSFAQHPEPGDMGEDLLVQSAQAGQEWAFVELCTRNSKRVSTIPTFFPRAPGWHLPQ